MLQQIRHKLTYSPTLKHKEQFHQNLDQLHQKLFSGELCGSESFAERRCVVCGSEDFAFVFKTSTGFSFVECRNCKMVMMQPAPAPACLDKLYNSQEMFVNASGKKASGTVSPGGKHDLQFILKYKQQGSLLDIGCGVGAFLMSAGKHFSAEGIEINTRQTEIGQANHLRIFNRYSHEHQPDQPYDIITLLQVIEHLYDPGSVIQDAHRMLAPEGLLYLACPNFDSLSMRLFRQKHIHVSSFGHINLFHPAALQQLVEKKGFEIVHLETYMLDIALHDLLYFYFAPGKFRHRFANYQPFLYKLSNKTLDPLMVRAYKQLSPGKKGSYIRAIFKKR